MTREEATPVEANDNEREANMKLGRIGVLMGGVSAEREVSLKTGSNVADALERRGHEVVRIDWGADARSIDELLREARVDRVVLALHGRGGEDGCVQGYLELMGIPYTGSNVLSSALAMDKLKAKELFRLHNVPTPPYYSVSHRTRSELEDLHGTFGFPVIVKPRSEGSSVGLAKASSMEELTAGVDAALAIDPVSSSGVQKAIQGALAGAVVANTLLRRPGDGGAAIAFYRDMLAGASRRHARWTSGHYASVARGGFDAFWRARAAGAEDADEAPGAQGRALAPAEFGAARLVASPDLRIVEQPCLDADFVVARRAIAHPGLDGPVAYLGEQELAPLLDGLPAGLTAFELARAWQARLPPRAGLATAAWMVERGLLLREDEARGART